MQYALLIYTPEPERQPTPEELAAQMDEYNAFTEHIRWKFEKADNLTGRFIFFQKDNAVRVHIKSPRDSNSLKNIAFTKLVFSFPDGSIRISRCPRFWCRWRRSFLCPDCGREDNQEKN